MANLSTAFTPAMRRRVRDGRIEPICGEPPGARHHGAELNVAWRWISCITACRLDLLQLVSFRFKKDTRARLYKRHRAADFILRNDSSCSNLDISRFLAKSRLEQEESF